MTDLKKQVICSGSPACGFTQCPHFVAHLSADLSEADGWREPQPDSLKTEYCSTSITECTQIISDVECAYIDGTKKLTSIDDLIYDRRNSLTQAIATIDGLKLEKLTCVEAALCPIALAHDVAAVVEDSKGDLVIQVNDDMLAQAAAISASVDNKCKK